MVAQPPRVELYLRSLAPAEGRQHQETVVERLRSLTGSGRITDFEVVLCGDCVCPSLSTADSAVGERLLDRYETFQEWADDTDRDHAGFTRREGESLLTDTAITGIVFPRVTIAEYRNGDLTFVAPSTNETEHTSVADRIDALRDGR